MNNLKPGSFIVFRKIGTACNFNQRQAFMSHCMLLRVPVDFIQAMFVI